jgi:hypothetical protein
LTPIFSVIFGEDFSEMTQKIRRQNSAAEISGHGNASLLANDTGIILRQGKASLMLLFQLCRRD